MTTREGNLEAPTRHPLEWRSADFHDEPKLYAELERVFDICHGWRPAVTPCPPCLAAPQGGEVPEGRDAVPRQAAFLDRRDRQAGRDSGGRADGQRSKPERRRTGGEGAGDWRAPGPASAAIQPLQVPARGGRERSARGPRRGTYCRQGRRRCDLLCELQRARYRAP